MTDDTINDDKTIAGGGKDVILAGRYHILRQLGQGEWYNMCNDKIDSEVGELKT